MRTFKLISLGVWLAAAAVTGLRADTFQLTDGRTITGEMLTGANDVGMQVKTDDGKYEKVSWSDLSQATLKELAQKPKLAAFVEPFIEIPQEERLKKTEVTLKDVPRLERPAKGSLLGGLLHSSVGLVILLLLYGANIYAGYEIGLVRAYPPAMVCGIAAVAPVVGPVIFLCIPTRMEKPAAEEVTAAPAEYALPASPAAEAQAHAGGGHRFADAPASPAAPAAPQAQVFQRGQFTFNRRFIETKFSGFFGVVGRGADKDMVLLIKTPRGEFPASRISRIAANDMHVEVRKGVATQEVQIPFGEIQEIQLKHKDA